MAITLTSSHTNQNKTKTLCKVNRGLSSNTSSTSMTPSTRSLSNSSEPSLKDGADPKVVANISLIPLNSSFGIVTANIHDQQSLHDMIRRRCKESKTDIVIVFAVRRPGCGACREHGLQLSELVANDNKITCVGIVKESGSEDVDEGLLEFYQDYFKFPLFKDEKWNIYKAMGNRAVSKISALFHMPKLLQRFRNNRVATRVTGGDHFTQGGILIFDRKGKLQYTYYEEYAELLDMNLIKQAISDIRKEKMRASVESASTSTDSMSDSMSLDN